MNLKIFLFTSWNGLVLGPVEICFLEAGAYMSLNQATTVSEKVVFAKFEWKYYIFVNIKTEE